MQPAHHQGTVWITAPLYVQGPLRMRMVCGAASPVGAALSEHLLWQEGTTQSGVTGHNEDSHSQCTVWE